MKKLFIAVLTLFLSLQALAADPPKREFRSIWMAAMGIDWPYDDAIGNEALAKQQFIEYIENFKRHNFSNICLQIRPLADALYRSTLEPWSASVSGTRGKDPGWDPLQFAIEECHKRGIEIYAWINPFRINKDGGAYTTPFDLEWREKGWELKSGNWTIFNLAVPDARQHCLDVIKEVYDNYDVDGMLFDDYFYPGDKLTQGPSAGDYQAWKEAEGDNGLSIADWRRQNVNQFVLELYNMIQRDRPDMRFGIGPAGVAGSSAYKYNLPSSPVGYDWQYDDIYADPLAWLSDGSIDFISPQIYWSRSQSTAFTPLAKWWNDVAQHFGRHNYISMASYKVNEPEFGGNNEKGWNEFVAQVEIGRGNATDNAPGQIYFSAVQFDGPTYTGLGDWLEKHVYQRPSLTPVIDWKDPVKYGAPASGSFDGTTLSWEPVKGEGFRTIIRYTLYAVPKTIAYQDALAADGDGIDGKYLLDVSYDTSYTIPEDMRRKYWFAVCVYDGYGYEYEPLLINHPNGQSTSTEITSPATGAVADWDFKVTWKAVPGASYIAELSVSPDFTTLIAEKDDLTEPEAIFDLSDLSNNTTCYVRVAVDEPGKFLSYTQPRAFLSPTRVEAGKAELLTPGENSTISTGNVEFTWTPVKNAERYLLQITHSEFDNIVYSQMCTEPSAQIDALLLGSGGFQWRVLTSGRRVYQSISETGSFSLQSQPVGTYEKGYESKQDNGTLTYSLGSTQIHNLWYRSADDENCPFTLEGDGSYNRSMVGNADFVFITGRTANNKNAESYLLQYSAETGELLRRITLGEATTVANLPCNQVVKDTKNNIYVVDQTSSVTSRPLAINRVNLATGELTEVAVIKGKTPTAGRVDFAAIYGDASTGSFYVFAAVTSKAILLRWTIEDGEAVDISTITAKEFSGKTSNFGVAPRIYPVSEELAWIDHSNGPASLYNFTTGTMVTSIDRLIPGAENWAVTDNGFATVEHSHGNLVACASGITATDGCRIAIHQIEGTLEAPVAHPFDYKPALVPVKSFGTKDEVDGAALVDFGIFDIERANLYVYSPGNGLAAYFIGTPAGIRDISADTRPSIKINGLNVILSETADEINAYTPAGALVTTARNATSLELPSPGLYIIKANGIALPVSVK
ncbi:MAG: family 10 glycosylhydrolase [Odoribacter sp.]|nr:family 10 glycosylhydrolase [Odoribacter sp.]